jgi:ankyrin repeat protein
MTIIVLNYTRMTNSVIVFVVLLLTIVFPRTTLVVVAADSGEIFRAVQLDDETSIKSVIEKDPSLLESKNGGGQTPLINAVLMGKLNAVNTLLDLDADTSQTEKDGYNVLHAAGFQGRADILKVLLYKKGLDPMDKHTDGYYPIHRACWGRETRHTDTVEVFLEYGISPNLPAENGKTCAEMTPNEGTRTLLSNYKGSKSEL